MVVHVHAFTANGKGNALLWPLGISFGLHLLLFALVIYSPQWRSERDYMPSVIDVRMVELVDRTATTTPKGNSSTEPSAVTPPPNDHAPESVATPITEAAKPEISVAPKRKKTKKALKYKTFKTETVKKKALNRLKQKVETTTAKPLQDRFRELRDKVAKEGRPDQEQTVVKEGTQAVGGSGFAKGKKKELELIDIYRIEISAQIRKNWAYSQQLAGSGRLEAKLVIKVLPDGTIDDIFFVDRSGNPYLDESAHKAIIKSSPVQPHPPGIKRRYVEMGLRFTPEGLF